MNFGNTFLFQSVFIIVFSKNIYDGVRLTSVIVERLGVTAVKYQISYCSQGCCPSVIVDRLGVNKALNYFKLLFKII